MVKCMPLGESSVKTELSSLQESRNDDIMKVDNRKLCFIILEYLQDAAKIRKRCKNQGASIKNIHTIRIIFPKIRLKCKLYPF